MKRCRHGAFHAVSGIFLPHGNGERARTRMAATLTRAENFIFRVGIWKMQSEWPIGMPHVRPLENGFARSPKHPAAQVLFIVDGNDLGVLHIFIKKTQNTARGFGLGGEKETRLWPQQRRLIATEAAALTASSRKRAFTKASSPRRKRKFTVEQPRA
jgi:hypothetical protein